MTPTHVLGILFLWWLLQPKANTTAASPGDTGARPTPPADPSVPAAVDDILRQIRVHTQGDTQGGDPPSLGLSRATPDPPDTIPSSVLNGV